MRYPLRKLLVDDHVDLPGHAHLDVPAHDLARKRALNAIRLYRHRTGPELAFTARWLDYDTLRITRTC